MLHVGGSPCLVCLVSRRLFLPYLVRSCLIRPKRQKYRGTCNDRWATRLEYCKFKRFLFFIDAAPTETFKTFWVQDDKDQHTPSSDAISPAEVSSCESSPAQPHHSAWDQPEFQCYRSWQYIHATIFPAMNTLIESVAAD